MMAAAAAVAAIAEEEERAARELILLAEVRKQQRVLLSQKLHLMQAPLPPSPLCPSPALVVWTFQHAEPVARSIFHCAGLTLLTAHRSCPNAVFPQLPF